MAIDLTIFKSYDVRGKYPDSVNEEAAHKIGRAFVRILHAQKIVVGRDMRKSSPSIQNAVIKGMIEQGTDVHDIGLCSTDQLYFSVNLLNADGGVMVTASHNPEKDNGLKLCGKTASPFGIGSGLEKIKETILHESFSPSEKKGTLIQRDTLSEYAEKCLSFIDVKKLKPMKMVVDAGNGMAGKTFPLIQKKLPGEIIPLFFELDGSFPNHVPNPVLDENLSSLRQTLLAVHADVGIAFDGDADRVVLMDEKGVALSANEIIPMLATHILSHSPNKSRVVVHDLRVSKSALDIIQRAGGKPVSSIVGNASVKKKMREVNAIFGGELAGHYFFSDFFSVDSGMVAALLLLQIISLDGRKLSEIRKSYHGEWHHSGEFNFVVQDKEKMLQKVKQSYQSLGKISELDGVSVDLGEWWFNVRPSNTEPLLRMVVEANSPELLKEKTDELRRLLTH